jgi:iron complex outermembrane receptor protein
VEAQRRPGADRRRVLHQAGRARPHGRLPDAGRQLAGGRVHAGHVARHRAVVNGYHVNTTQVYNYDLGNFDSYAQTDRYQSQSQNYNLELKYDNGGKFTGSVRGIYGKAHQDYDQSYLQFSLSDGSQWQPGGVGHYPASLGGDRVFNAGGYKVNTLAGAASLPAKVDYTGSKPVFTLPSQLLTELGDINSYALKTVSSEGNYRRDGDLKVVRADGKYDFNDNFKLSAGARYSERSVDDYEFDRAAPLYGSAASNGTGCLVKWKAFDVPLGDASCSAGDARAPTPPGSRARPTTRR